MVSVWLQQCSIYEQIKELQTVQYDLLAVYHFTSEPSPLELPLLPDITTQLLSMAAACLFLVTFLRSCSKICITPIITCDFNFLMHDLIFFRWLHWWHLLQLKPEKQKWPLWVQVCNGAVDWVESGWEVKKKRKEKNSPLQHYFSFYYFRVANLKGTYAAALNSVFLQLVTQLFLEVLGHKINPVNL